MLARVMAIPTLEQELARALRRGYVAAFRWLGNPDESRELCQEAAARVLAARDRFDPSRPFYPWFYRILKNLCLDRLGRRKRAAQAAEALRHAPPPGGGTAEGQLIAEERQRAVAAAIDALPPEMREVIELRHFQDLSYEEMADLLGCPLGTVMSRLYRARRALRERLFEVEVEGGTP